MLLQLFVLATAVAVMGFIFPSTAMATPEVEVVNTPLEVEVVNPPPTPPPPRWQLVGFTAQTYSGDVGGPFGATRMCQMEFPGSRVCTRAEVRQTTTLPVSLAGQARIAEEGGGGDCADWSREFANNGPPLSETCSRRIDARGVTLQGEGCDCTELFSFACCALVP